MIGGVGMFEKIDFKNGVISYCDESRQEGMLEVMYPHQLLLAVGWDAEKARYDLYEVNAQAPDVPLKECHTAEPPEVVSTLQNWIDDAARQ